MQCADVTAYMEKELLPFDDELSDRTVYQLEKSVPYTVQVIFNFLAVLFSMSLLKLPDNLNQNW